ncbi:MAG TPA: A/G-specific adenine glycosylase, partial [Patescibacteria group bacterium]|nr:A/G-specific adenine glycosylase [Patescibacteria group bacterium]
CIPKFKAFIKRFPNFKSLAAAPLSEVLRLWQGLGYNRRAVYLKRIAEIVARAYGNTPLPDDPNELRKFPGVGSATAASIVVYAFNKPYPFIETNVRSVYIHHFFTKRTQREGVQQYAPTRTEPITDSDLLPLVEATMDSKNPREWFYALMDYGVYLKKQHQNPSRRSAHHVTQSKFEGSNRQLRGRIIKTLVEQEKVSIPVLAKIMKTGEKKLQKNINQLAAEGFLTQQNGSIRLSH